MRQLTDEEKEKIFKEIQSKKNRLAGQKGGAMTRELHGSEHFKKMQGLSVKSRLSKQHDI